MRRVSALLVAGALYCAAPPAFAQSKTTTVQVLTLSSDKAFENAQALTIALKRAVDRSRRYALGKGDFSLEVVTLSLGCSDPPDPPCKKKIGSKVGTDGYVWGSVEREGDEVVASLHLWEASGAETETTIRYAANLVDASDDVLLDIAERAFAELAGGATAPLVVRGEGDGEVWVDGEKLGTMTAGRAELLLEPGDHEVRLKRPGREDLVGKITVTANARAELDLRPSRRLGEDTETAPEASKDGGGSLPTRKLYGYGALGIGAGFVVGGIYSALQVSSIDSDSGFASYRSALPKGEDVCDAADRGVRPTTSSTDPADVADQCSRAKTFNVLQYVFFGLGAVAVGTGAYFLLSDDPKPAPSARFKPRFNATASARGGFVDLSFRF
jgi:hypothetical protein